MALLEIENLTVEFDTVNGRFRALDGVSYRVEAGEVLAIVGESGSGKSVAMLAVMGLLANNGHLWADKLTFEGHDLLKMSAKQRRKIIGKEISMIFQEPIASLNPCFTVGSQIDETLKEHTSMSRGQRKARAIELLEICGDA